MKNTILLLILFAVVHSSHSQDITGSWTGKLNVQGIQLRLVFHILKNDTTYVTTMDSPDQGAKGIPVTKTNFDSLKLKLDISNLGVEYEGIFKDTVINGTFRQHGMSLPLDLKRDSLESLSKRPQEPVKPYPYYTEEISFNNPISKIKLAGTLSIPHENGIYPAVILITGSGPQNRDEELAGHKPFLVISDYLTRHGIAVLRFDDRGVGKSEGNFKLATTADFATDVESALEYLKTRKEIDKNNIGLVGHSEGAIVAAMTAAKLQSVSFIVLLAGPGMRGDQLLLLQQHALARAAGLPDSTIERSKEVSSTIFNMIIHSKNEEKLSAGLADYLQKAIEKNLFSLPQGVTREQFIQLQVAQLTSPWMKYFLSYDPGTALKKIKCPVLALNGEKDLQVPAKENLAAINEILKKNGNKHSTVKELEGLNHLFQHCKTGLPDEYPMIEETFSPQALDEITTWILQRTR
jgi:pimeloyl-ACP methyl ester carboxylesterase